MHFFYASFCKMLNRREKSVCEKRSEFCVVKKCGGVTCLRDIYKQEEQKKPWKVKE